MSTFERIRDGRQRRFLAIDEVLAIVDADYPLLLVEAKVIFAEEANADGVVHRYACPVRPCDADRVLMSLQICDIRLQDLIIAHKGDIHSRLIWKNRRRACAQCRG